MITNFLRIAVACIFLTGCAQSKIGVQSNENDANAKLDDVASETKRWSLNVWRIGQQNFDVTFYAPQVSIERLVDKRERYYRLERHQRFSVSLNFAKPNCAGEQNAQAHIKCLIGKIKHNPHLKIDENTISQTAHKDGQILTYMSIIGKGAHKMKIINTHVVFEHSGHWGDLHASILQPNHREFLTMLKFPSLVSINTNRIQ
ncbi:MAG: hypothetical protein BM565_00170 [Gammaproteobacteria bacterium MedPE]|nr:MAG: hypothetical protein BM565_00170 [Gammaproteobacteria bacterium MedPE]